MYSVFQRAVQKLMRGNEPELAYALTVLLRLSRMDHVAMALARRSERCELWYDSRDTRVIESLSTVCLFLI